MATSDIVYFDRDAGRATFGLKLFQVMANGNSESNIFISPISIGLLLSILYHGARGATRDEIAAAVGASDCDDLERSRRCWFDTLRQSGEDLTIELANSLWLQEGNGISQEFRDTVMLRFEAWVEELDLHTDEALRRINDWANRATYGKISSVITEVDPAAVQIAASAIWFKGMWGDPFDPAETRMQAFHTVSGPTEAVFMKQEGHFRYTENEDFQAIAIPYKGPGSACMFFYPNAISEILLRSSVWPTGWTGTPRSILDLAHWSFPGSSCGVPPI